MNLNRLNSAVDKATDARFKVTLLPPELRHDGWFRTYAGTLLGTLALIVLILGALGLVDRIDRDADARVEFLRTADEKCIPLQKGDTGIATNTGRQVRCEVWANASTGMARRLVSAAVMDIPR